MSDCIFCKIINQEIPSYKIYEDDHTYAFLDISKMAYGHTLVIPKNHSENIFEIPQKDLEKTIETVKMLSKHYKSLGFSGVNILNNNGTSAEQSINHLHFHIIPRNDDDHLKIFPNLNKQNIDLNEVQKKLCKKSCH